MEQMEYIQSQILAVDEAISHIFLKNTLCKLLAQNESTLV